jgi:Flp pilus assembly protein protease CpaA
MLHLLILPQLVAIALRDIRTLRISNLSLVFLTATFIILDGGTSNAKTLFFSLPIVALLYICGVGMGDVKLLSILIYFTPSLIINFHYLYGVALGAILTMAIFSRKNRDRRVPFAPALIAPYLALYLVM